MLATLNGNFRDDYNAPGGTAQAPDDRLADLAVADKAGEEAQACLAGMWAALRQAGRSELASPLVSILAQLRAVRDEVGRELDSARDEAGKRPADWFLEN